MAGVPGNEVALWMLKLGWSRMLVKADCSEIGSDFAGLNILSQCVSADSFLVENSVSFPRYPPEASLTKNFLGL